MSNNYLDDVLDSSSLNTRITHNSRHSISEAESAVDFVAPRAGDDSPLDEYNAQTSPSDTEASTFPKSPIDTKHRKDRSSRSSSSTSLPNALPEKHGRGFSRFFSKGKSDR